MNFVRLADSAASRRERLDLDGCILTSEFFFKSVSDEHL